MPEHTSATTVPTPPPDRTGVLPDTCAAYVDDPGLPLEHAVPAAPAAGGYRTYGETYDCE